MAAPYVTAVLDLLQPYKLRAGGANQWSSRCPSHQDDQASLSIGIGKNNGVLFNCKANQGCSPETITAALGITMADLFPPESRKKQQPRNRELIHPYYDEDGELLFEIVRKYSNGKKDIRQRKPDGAGGWVYSTTGLRKPLYRLPKIIQAIADGKTIHLMEGETDVEAMEERGFTATCNPGGAGKWLAEHTATLANADVVLVVDNDQPGYRHGFMVAEALEGVAKSFKSIQPPTDYGDARAALEAGVPFDHFPELNLYEILETYDPFYKVIEEVKALVDNGGEFKHKLARVHSIADRAAETEAIEGFGELTNFGELLNKPIQAYDWIVPDMIERGDRIMVVGGEGAGKALALDTPIATPDGWSTMGELRVGDQVFGSNGQPVKIVAATQPMTDRSTYEVIFSDGERIVSDANHQWEVITYRDRQDYKWDRSILTTEEMAQSVKVRDGYTLNYLVEQSPALDLPEVELPIEPYLLGVWLGDGNSHNGVITSIDPQVREEVEKLGWETTTIRTAPESFRVHKDSEHVEALEGALELVGAGMSYRGAERETGIYYETIRRYEKKGLSKSPLSGLTRLLVENDLQRNKHIPEQYFRASEGQRRELLAGLLDSDGTAQRNSVEITLTNATLAMDVLALIRTLGFRPSVNQSEAKLDGRVVGQRWRIRFTPDRPVFKLDRKQNVLKGMCHYRSVSRYIKEINPIESVPVRCIQVANPNGIFLAGNTMVRTHNSYLLRQIALHVAEGLHPFHRTQINPMSSLFLDLENPERVIARSSQGVKKGIMERKPYADFKKAHILRKPDGMDILNGDDRAQLINLIESTSPDMLVISPIYKFYNASGSKEHVNDLIIRVVKTIDQLRETYRFAVLMEHHAPFGNDSNRVMRPIDSTVWLRWPEIGISMSKTIDNPNVFDLKRFRGDRDTRSGWPASVDRSGEFGWSSLG